MDDVITRRLREGYGAEDIALMEAVPVAQVRAAVQRLREEDRLRRIVSVMDRRSA